MWYYEDREIKLNQGSNEEGVLLVGEDEWGLVVNSGMNKTEMKERPERCLSALRFVLVMARWRLIEAVPVAVAVAVLVQWVSCKTIYRKLPLVLFGVYERLWWRGRSRDELLLTHSRQSVCSSLLFGWWKTKTGLRSFLREDSSFAGISWRGVQMLGCMFDP